MLKRINILLIVLLFLFIVSCENHKNGYTDSLSCQNIYLHAKTLNDSTILAAPKKCFLWDSLLLVMDARCGDNLFYVFSTFDGAFLKGGGKKGEGPGEVIAPSDTHLSSEGVLSYWDINKNKMVKYNIGKLLSNSEQYFKEITLEGERKLDSFLDVIALKKGYLYNGNMNRYIGVFGTENYVDAPDLPNIPSLEISRAIMNKSHWAVAPNEKKMVRATSIGGIVECYKIEDNKVEEHWSKLFFPPIYKLLEGVSPAWITWCEDSQMGFDNLYVTDQCIYLLLNGKLAKEKPFANEILVMDWKGNLIKKFILDKTVKTIAVDEEKKIIYATTSGFDVEANIITFSF